MALVTSIRAAEPASLATSYLVVALPAGAALPPGLRSLDRALGGELADALRRREFRGARDELLTFTGGAKGPRRVALVGLGTPVDRALALRRAAAVGARAAQRLGTGEIAFWGGPLDPREAEQVVVGLHHGAWEYTDLKTPPPAAERRKPLAKATLIAPTVGTAVKDAVAAGRHIAAGYALTRRLGMMPGNLCTPQYLAETARELAARHGLKVTVLGRKQLEELGAGSFLCVAQGTPQEPHLITLEYKGGARGQKPVVLVGKGLCFDSGGISLKPAERMEWMKFDMSGAGGVLGAIDAIARLALPINVVAAIGTTTNMPSGTAVKPGDVVRAMNGKTIEIINTDAEGRLVLADVLSYVARFEPSAVVDAATLTGAVVIGLGNTTTGVMGSDAALVQEVLIAARRAGEPGWELPLWDEYKELIKSDVADIKNSGGRAAGTITAGQFLAEFAEGYPWVHLDIAGTAYTEADLGVTPRGPTGVPVGIFLEFVRGRVR
jgi:leucyl aminopeptidase